MTEWDRRRTARAGPGHRLRNLLLISTLSVVTSCTAGPSTADGQQGTTVIQGTSISGTNGGTVPTGTPGLSAGTGVTPAAGLADLLDTSWAGNGTEGFFVEAAEPGQAMSLYSTRWWLDVLRAAGKPMPGTVEPAAVQAWAAPIAAGRSGSAGDLAGLPVLEQIDDAVDILQQINLPVETGPVAAALGRLLDGNQYGAGPGTVGDLGDTSIAVGVLRKIGVAPPVQVQDAIATQLPRALTDHRPGDLLAFTVPEISAVSESMVSEHRSQLVDELQWIHTQLPEMPPVVRISVATTVAPLLARLHADAWLPVDVCAGLTISAAGVAASSTDDADPQLTSEALSAACIGEPEVPPWTPAGWPDTDAIAGSLPASVDGMRVAKSIGQLQKYVAPLRIRLAKVWAPALAAAPTAPVSVATDLLAQQLTVPILARPSAAEIQDALAGHVSGDVGSELLLALITRPKGASGETSGPIPRSGAGPSATSGGSAGRSSSPMVVAVTDELTARLTSDETDHEAAERIVRSLHPVGSSLFALAPSSTASLSATIFASWILHQPLPRAALTVAGICNQQYLCAGDDPATSVPPLQTAAAAIQLADPASDVYPYAY